MRKVDVLFCALVASFSCGPPSLSSLPPLALTTISLLDSPLLFSPPSPFAFRWRQKSEKKGNQMKNVSTAALLYRASFLLSPFCPEQPLLLHLFPLPSQCAPAAAAFNRYPSEHWQRKVQLSRRALPTKKLN